MSELRVLFVCTANICRSPYMELHARHLAGPDAPVSFTSAGTHGFDHRKMNESMVKELGEGIDPAGFRSRLLTVDMLREAHLVLCAEAAHRQFVLDEQPAFYRKVFTLGQFAEVVRRSDPSLSGPELVEVAAAVPGIAQWTADVADPYRRGAAAARTAATNITELLDVIVPALTRGR